MEKVIIHTKTFCKDINALIKSQVAAMCKKNPELDKKVKEWEALYKAALEKAKSKDIVNRIASTETAKGS